MLARQDSALEAGETNEQFADECRGLNRDGSGFAVKKPTRDRVELAEDKGVSEVQCATIPSITVMDKFSKCGGMQS